MRKTLSIGIDIGGTNTTVAVVNRAGEIIEKRTISTHCGNNDFNIYSDILANEIKSLISKYDSTTEKGFENDASQFVGIGIGAPCANYVTGTIDAATNLPWPSPIALKKIIEDKTGFTVSVTNDANAAALGEKMYGAARGLNNFIVLTLGTGVGSGIVCNGTLLTGFQGFAGELGHCRVVNYSDRKCACGRTGCLQTYCSAGGVVETALRLRDKYGDKTKLSTIPEKELTSAKIYDLAKEGDSAAKEVFDITGRCLGEACADYASFTDPEAIILFGGVAHAFDLIEPELKKTMNQNILHLYRDKIEILKSTMPENDAAIIGASALAWN